MMLSKLNDKIEKLSNFCSICFESLVDISSSPDICNHLYHYKCLRTYIDKRLDNHEAIICPEKSCKKFFGRILNQFLNKNENKVIYQNVLLTNDEANCCICFSKYKIPVASSDSCLHSFCFDCLKRWCTFKHECPMDRMPIKMLLISDFPGGHITSEIEPPPIEQDLNNGDGDNDELLNTTCEICNSGQNEHQLLLCDNCNRGYHIYCLRNPLDNIPDGDWFCEHCEDTTANTEDSGLLLRGIERVINNIENRNNSVNNNVQRIRNGRRNTRTGRTMRNRRVNGSESDVDWIENVTSEEEILPILRNRNNIETNSIGGIRTRRGRRNIQNSNNEVRIGTRSRSQFLVSDHEDSTNYNVSRQRRRLRVESPQSDDEEHITSNAIITRTTNNTRKRREGSLCSNIDSEPIRKRHRVGHSSTSNESRIVTGDEDFDETTTIENNNYSSTDIEDRSIYSPITTRLRARDNTCIKDNDDKDTSPLPRPAKYSRRISDDSEESTSCINLNILYNNLNTKKPYLFENNSSGDEIYNERVRHLSTSSSISTIPFKISENVILSQIQETAAYKSQPNVEDVFSNTSSTSEKSNSEYNSEISNSEWQPSPMRRVLRVRSKKKNTTRTPRRRSSRILIKHKKKRKEQSLNKLTICDERIDGQHQGRENHLPLNNNVGDDNSITRINRSFNSSGSILSEINESTINLRDNKYYESNVATTSNNCAPKKEKIILSIKNLQLNNNTCNQKSLPIIPPSTLFNIGTSDTVSNSIINDIPSTSYETLPPQIASCSNLFLSPQINSNSNTSKVSDYVLKTLGKFYNDLTIDKRDLEMLSKRIVEKVSSKRNGGDDKFQKKKVREFVDKYVSYYLTKRKNV